MDKTTFSPNNFTYNCIKKLLALCLRGSQIQIFVSNQQGHLMLLFFHVVKH